MFQRKAAAKYSPADATATTESSAADPAAPNGTSEAPPPATSTDASATEKSVATAPTTTDKKPASAVSTKVTNKPEASKPRDEFSGKFYPADPAMSAIGVIDTLVTTIEGIVNDIRNEDWSRVRAPETKEGEPKKLSEATTCKFELEKKQRQFRADPKGLASQLTVRILKDAIAVITEILAEVKTSDVKDWVKPDAESDLVYSWIERIERCSSTCLTIKQSSESTPGNSMSGVGSLFPKKSEAELNASTTQKSNLLQETIKSHTLKLTSTQEVYKGTMDTYKAIRDENVKMKRELEQAKQEVEQLKLDKITSVSQSLRLRVIPDTN